MLEKLGFRIHGDKSELEPDKNLVFSGFRLDSEMMEVSLTEDKEEKFVRAASELLEKDSPTIREVAGVVGLMVAYSQALNYGSVHLKHLEMEKSAALARSYGDFDARMNLAHEGREDILWWLDNIKASGKRLKWGKPQETLFTDASNEGWGAHVNGVTAGGRWSEKEKVDHINVLELRAIELELKSLCKGVDQHIKIMTDNTTALAYVRNQVGVKSPPCQQVAKTIWDWAEERQVWLSIAHIPGIHNVLADHKSRHFKDNLEWAFSDRIFAKIVHIFGNPMVDLFASRLNKKVEKYVSWGPDPGAVEIDAFSFSWTDIFFYAFPPFSCVGRAVEKAVEDNASGVLVVPHWPSRPWWGRLKALGLRSLYFRPRKGNLRPVGNQTTCPC